jgi:hypothetical protein
MFPSGRLFRQKVPAPKKGPTARLRAPVASAAMSLRFSDWLVVLVISLAYLFAVSTPVFSIKLYLSTIGHLPLLLLGPALALQIMGSLLNRNVPTLNAIASTTWPLVFLGIFALVGSALAKWQYSVTDTYLTFAVYLLLLPLYVAAVPTNPVRARQWAVSLVCVWIAFSFVAFIGELARIGGSDALHEIEYMVFCGFFVLYSVSRSTAIKVLALLCLLAAAALNQKLTGYFVAILAILHIVVVAGWRRLPKEWRGAYGFAAVVSTVLLISVLALLYFEYRRFLPSGNIDVRLAQYEAAVRQFLISPFWGSGFTDSSGEAYAESARVLYIPTHSDILDMLKHGGLIALVLLLWGYWKLFALFNRAIDVTRDDRILNAYFVGVRFFQATALLTFAINPILLKGAFLIVIWGNLGLAAGVALAICSSRSETAEA